MNWTATIDLKALLSELADRAPGRSEATVQSKVHTLLLAAPLNLEPGTVIKLEAQAGDRKRIDVETGFTVIEVKRDLRVGTVREEAVEQLAGYVRQRAAIQGQRYVGVLTDGAEWTLYHLTPAEKLEPVGSSVEIDPEAPDVQVLLDWLEGVLATTQDVVPTPQEIEAQLGAKSPSHALDIADLTALYEANKNLPSIRLKREVWAKLLTAALGTSFRDDDALFVEHTLLVVTAEIIAHAVVGYPPGPLAPATILTGSLFEQAQIAGVVEEDFFDWLVDDGVAGGDSFVRALARRLSRFSWGAVEHDVMKVLYESVISTEQRHSLGEYYTPDWLAHRIVDEVVTSPLEQRVLDPSCGSGTFLFWAVRRYLTAADAAGYSNAEGLRGATEAVIGVDVHPLAVAFARVTYLLALGMDRIAVPGRPALSVPVYLGDSVQWRQQQTLLQDGAPLSIETSGSQLTFEGSELKFPQAVIADAPRFDQLVAELSTKSSNRAPLSPLPSLNETFRRFPMSDADKAVVSATFGEMCRLNDEGRNHIWSYYIRNLARPTWLAQEAHRVDVVLGNPPWLNYNAMPAELKPAFRAACEERNLWGGARAARNYDLSALFVVRAIELYLKKDGVFGFVMPYAALSRRQFTGFRKGDFPSPSEEVLLAFDTPWDLDAIRPSPFLVPAAVVFGKRAKKPVPLRKGTLKWSGRLPGRNLDWGAAEPHITVAKGSITVGTGEHGSPYARRFESGAKANPRVLIVVGPAPTAPLGMAAGFRRVRSLPSMHPPWRDVTALEGTIEKQFVRPLYASASIAPFRPLEPVEMIVPWDSATKSLLTNTDERIDRYPQLAEWWKRANELWTEHGTPETYDLTGRIDFQHKLTRQLPPATHRVVYVKSGSKMAAARLTGSAALVQDDLYVGTAADEEEALYLVAILNSDAVTKGVGPYQSRGQFGARHFDKYVWYLSIPEFSSAIPEHVRLAELGALAEGVAAGVELPDGLGFRAARSRVRSALTSSGVARDIDKLARVLLGF